MITEVGCRGYRAFDAPTALKLGDLTVIFGKNNSGKTTLTRLPLFVRAALGNKAFYALHDDLGLRYGSSFRDLTNLKSPHPSLEYWISTSTGDTFRVQLQSVLRGFEEGVQLTDIRGNGFGATFAVGADSDPSGNFTLTDGTLTQLPETLSILRKRQLKGASRAVHIPSARPHIDPVYESRTATTHSVREVPYLLLENPDLVNAVSDWLTRMLDGLTLEVEHSDYAFRLVTTTQSGGVNFASTGRGSQALLPLVVIVQALKSGLLAADLIVVEEPEAHLHPSAHGAVAELLLEASQYAQVITETHSENFILRLRRKIAEGEMSHSSVSLAFVDDNHEVWDIGVDETGSVTDWPAGVFEYDVAEARAIVDARLGRLRAQ